MLQVHYYDRKTVHQEKVTERLLKARLRSKSVFWVDFIGHTQAEIDLIKKVFGIHHLVIEDCVHGGNRPKIDQFKHHNYLVMFGMRLDKRTHITFPQLNFIIGKNFVLTIHKQRVNSFEGLKKEDKLLKETLAKGSDYLLHKLIDLEVDHYFPVLDQLEQDLDNMQDRALDDTHPAELEKLFHTKKQINHMRRIITPERDLVGVLSKPHIKFIRAETDLYFRDIQEHLTHIGDRVDTNRDILANIIDLHLSVASNKMNEVMKVLTIFATIMLPLTVIGSIYGMNFKYMPELEWRYGYHFVWGIMILIVVLMLWWFRKKKWI